MDYVVGSIAELLSGNVTPNRPKQLRNVQTPMKHQPSPNVMPKSEFVEDRSIFLSPTMQKRKAMAKKSPKRIFQNPDPEGTNGEDNDSSLVSPKADKVKKHLKDELEANSLAPTILLSPKSPKHSEVSPKKGNKKRLSDNIVIDENSPKKKRRKSETGVNDSMIPNGQGISKTDTVENSISKKENNKQLNKFIVEEINISATPEKNSNMIPNGEGISKTDTVENSISKKKNKKQLNKFIVEEINISATPEKNSNMIPNGEGISKTDTVENSISKKKNKKQLNKFIVEEINISATRNAKSLGGSGYVYFKSQDGVEVSIANKTLKYEEQELYRQILIGGVTSHASRVDNQTNTIIAINIRIEKDINLKIVEENSTLEIKLTGGIRKDVSLIYTPTLVVA